VIRIIAAAFAVIIISPAFAAGSSHPEPAQAALVQMLQEAQGREANALVQLYAARAQVAAEKARADEAEARIKASTDKPDK
jgi:hypothetical protein